MALRPRYKFAILLGIVGVGFGATIAWAGRDLVHPHLLAARLGEIVSRQGPWRPVAFVALYTVSPFLMLPAIPLSLLAGVLFGAAKGALLNLAGSTLGAALSFLAGRSLGHDFVAKRAHGPLLAVKSAIEEEGWRFVAFLRLVPILPFGIANLALGTTDLSFGSFLLTSVLAMAPGAWVYAYAGSAGRAAAAGMGLARVELAIGLLVLLSGIPAALRYSRSRIRKERSPPPSPPGSPSLPEARRGRARARRYRGAGERPGPGSPAGGRGGRR